MILLIEGKCNQCGACCVTEYKGRMCKCEHLVTTPILNIGEPLATKCGKYGSRYDGMPLRVLYEDGTFAFNNECHKDCNEEVRAILVRGIGKGCSLTITALKEKK